MTPMYSGPNTSLSTRRNSTSQDRFRAVELRNVGGGFPHSEIVGSKLVRSSPTLIAAYHVLHRLSAPRHPPNALKALDRSHDRRPFRRSWRTLIPNGGRKSLDQLASWFAHATARSGAVSCQTSRILRATGSEGGTNQSFTMSDNTRTTRRRVKDLVILTSTANLLRFHLEQKHNRHPAPGGARRDRTDDLMLAKHALSQLSYGPVKDQTPG